MDSAPDLLDIDGLHRLLVERLGAWAPKRETLRTWARPNVQARDPFLQAHMPKARRMRGHMGCLYRRADCEGLPTAILSDAETGDAA